MSGNGVVRLVWVWVWVMCINKARVMVGGGECGLCGGVCGLSEPFVWVGEEETGECVCFLKCGVFMIG